MGLVEKSIDHQRKLGLKSFTPSRGHWIDTAGHLSASPSPLLALSWNSGAAAADASVAHPLSNTARVRHSMDHKVDTASLWIASRSPGQSRQLAGGKRQSCQCMHGLASDVTIDDSISDLCNCISNAFPLAKYADDPVLAIINSSQYPSKEWWFELFHNGWPAWIFPGIAGFLFVNLYTLWLERQVALLEGEAS